MNTPLACYNRRVATAKGEAEVAGRCRAGHVSRVTTAKGRVTWEGPCQTEGCSHMVRCTRAGLRAHLRDLAADATPDRPGPAGNPATGNDADTGGSSTAPGRASIARKVTYTHEQPEHEQRRDDAPGHDDGHDAGGGDHAGGVPAPDHDGSAVTGEAPRVEPPTEHHSEQQARRRNGRWRRQGRGLTREQRRAAREQVDRDWIVPGVLPR